MFVRTVEPAFHDTDALGHINNIRLLAWFELARTYLPRLGNSSFTVTQEAHQNGTLAVLGNAVMIYYDHQEKRSMPIEGELRCALEQHLHEEQPT